MSGADGCYCARSVELAAHPGAALQLLAHAPAGERFYYECAQERRALAATGVCERLEADGPGRFPVLAAALRALAPRVDVARRARRGDPVPSPCVVGGFAFADTGPAAATGAGHGADAAAASRAAATSAAAADASAADWRGWPSASFVLPEWLYEQRGARAWLWHIAPRAADASRVQVVLAQRAAWLERTCANAASGRAPSGAAEYLARPDRPHARFLATLDEAIARIVDGQLGKVVVARSLCVDSDVPYDVVSLLASLRATQPASTVFAVERAGCHFVGASPERLVALDGDRVRTAALAGTAARGRSPEQDTRLGRALRESKKEQEEHAFVVAEIEAALRPLCAVLERPEAPRLRALGALQHLETPFEGRLRAGLAPRPGLFDLAGRLHPTPAVCGTPRRAARAWLAGHERLERGWYAGGVGFARLGGAADAARADGDGLPHTQDDSPLHASADSAAAGGELSVALRSGLLRGTHARLYAGAGVVAASQPADELVETRLKLRTMLSQLTEI